MNFLIYENESLSHDICDTIMNIFNTYFTMKINTVQINFKIKENDPLDNIKNILMNQIKYHLELYLTSQLSTNLNVTNISINKCNVYKFFKNHNINSKNIVNYCKFSKKLTLFSFIWILNDVEDEWIIKFYNDYKIKPEKGKIILFPSEWFIPFSMNNSLSNELYIIQGVIFIDV